MAEIILQAIPRPPQGTRPARRLRNEGKIPGVVYGLGADPIPLTVEWRELRAALITEQGLNAVINLEVDGQQMPTLLMIEFLKRSMAGPDSTPWVARA